MVKMEVGVNENEKAEFESMTGRLQNSVKINGERRVVEFSKLLRETDDQNFSFGRVK